MSILNRWRQFGKRLFWPHLLLGVVAAGMSAPAILSDNARQQTLSHSPTSVSRLNHAVQAISDNNLWQDVSRQTSQNSSPWRQQAIRRFLVKLAAAIAPAADNELTTKPYYFHELSQQDWAVVDSLAQLLLVDNPVIVSQPTITRSYNDDHLHGQAIAFWLVKQGRLRAGPVQFL